MSDLISLSCLIFGASLLGIATRPDGFFAVFWPANALLAGVMVRRPELTKAQGWVAAGLGYITADLITGNSLFATLWLTFSNIAGAAVAAALLLRTDEATWRMQRQLSALYLLLACSAASAVATITGCGAGSIVFNTSLHVAAMLWFSTELMNYVLVLPVLLTMPVSWQEIRTGTAQQMPPWLRWGPLISVVLSEISAFLLGGPGAIAFVVPALLWCALTYKVFLVTLLSMTVCFWKTLEVASYAFVFTPDHLPSVFSFRMGVTLLSLGPLAVACASAARNDALQKLDKAVNLDFLTGAMTRRAFMSGGERLLARLAREKDCVAVMMIDIDHFKNINDAHGHGAGDVVLAGFALTISQLLRPGDLFGRLGGEEFAVLLPRTGQESALAIAARLVNAVRNTANTLPDGILVYITASIGVIQVSVISADNTLDSLLKAADKRLYQAKRNGRDQTVAS
ncbi:diguanylate cyclase [Acidovorax sp. SDU_ACID1]|uniref:diguanylate cyclase n=1 Tax=Acidovorax sp. SDU_ACID1 TaxID=3136632 RepID=UPI00387389F5